MYGLAVCLSCYANEKILKKRGTKNDVFMKIIALRAILLKSLFAYVMMKIDIQEKFSERFILRLQLSERNLEGENCHIILAFREVIRLSA